ncbi:hypothetical protein AB1Y20_009945 [Prymnesium parvum]|uniref:Uncharacterized protein n=1 Tax=Prymnesium parvum TaxID=97485 RepID=A0AB34K5G4_PRYPA
MGEAVVNTSHLMAYVNEAKDEGNAAYKLGRLSDALNAWQRGLDAIAQVIDPEGAVKVPIAKADVELVLRARSVLHSNRGQALMSKEFWRRAISDLSAAVKVDNLNAKAIWRRYRCHRALRHWAEAETDLDQLMSPELQQAASPLFLEANLTPEKLAAEKAELQLERDKAEKVADETFEDRMEDAAHKGIEQLRHRFEEVTLRTGLRNNTELSSELAEMLTRPGGVSAEFVAAVYQIDTEDAQIIMDWIEKAVLMRSALSGGSLV